MMLKALGCLHAATNLTVVVASALTPALAVIIVDCVVYIVAVTVHQRFLHSIKMHKIPTKRCAACFCFAFQLSCWQNHLLGHLSVRLFVPLSVHQSANPSIC